MLCRDLFFEDLCRIFLSKACGDAARHLHQFFGSLTAEIIACEVFVEVRSVESGVERSVRLSIDVDAYTLVYMRVALLHVVALLAGGVLDEEEVVLGIACDCAVKIVADGDASRLACEELEVYARLCVGVDRLILIAIQYLCHDFFSVFKLPSCTHDDIDRRTSSRVGAVLSF